MLRPYTHVCRLYYRYHLPLSSRVRTLACILCEHRARPYLAGHAPATVIVNPRNR